jgi:photosystem II stability/assembly factor-like uncharacterized protein
MGTSFTANPVGWLQRRAIPLIAALALILLAVLVWRDRPAEPLQAASQTPVPATPVPEQWTQVPGLFDGRINTIALQDPEGRAVIYASVEGGVFRSADRGRSWSATNSGLGDLLVRSLALDPDDPNVLYAGTWNGKVHISEDAGSTWQERSTGLPPFEIRALAVHHHDPRILYAGTVIGVYTTTNRGLDWHRTVSFPGSLQCMVVDPDQPDVLYVGTAESGIYKTVNGGAEWFQLSTEFTDVAALAIPPRATRTVYALSEGKVYKTERAGILWQYADHYRDAAVATCLTVDPKDPKVVYVGLQDGLYKSVDGRQSWYRSEEGLTSEDWRTELRIVAVDPIDSQVLYAYAVTHTLTNTETGQYSTVGYKGNGQFLISLDAGETWQQHAMVQAQDEASIGALRADPKDGATFYASVTGGGLYKTTDEGDNWDHVGEMLPAASITDVAVDPVNTRNIYVALREGLVFRSKTGGMTWEAAGWVSEAQISALAVDPEDPSRIYAGTMGEGLFRSDDEAWEWTSVGDDIGREIRRIVIDPKGPNTTVYVLTEEGVYRSRDNGETWESYLFSVADIAPSVKGGEFMPVVAPRAAPDRVTGQGLSSSIVIQQGPVAAGAELKAMMVSPAVPTDLYVLVQGQGAFRVTESGQRWTALGPGLEGLQLQSLALSPDQVDLILVGTNKGIYRYQPTQ